MKPPQLFAFWLILGTLLVRLTMLARCGEPEAAAYHYLTNSVAKITKRAPSQFTFQKTYDAPKLELTNAAAVQSNLTLGGSCVVRSKSPVSAAGQPMNPSLPMQFPVLTAAQATIWKARTNAP